MVKPTKKMPPEVYPATEPATDRACANQEVQYNEVKAPEHNNIRHIEIDQLNFGYIVTIGCHRLAIESKDKLILKLSEYINDPQKTEAKFHKGELL